MCLMVQFIGSADKVKCAAERAPPGRRGGERMINRLSNRFRGRARLARPPTAADPFLLLGSALYLRARLRGRGSLRREGVLRNGVAGHVGGGGEVHVQVQV